MPFAITTKGPESRAAPPGMVVRGIDRSRGEGGFWAKIVFQDTHRKERYAFVQQHRMYDPGAPSSDPHGDPGDVTFNDANNSNPTGEQSLWNDAGTPFTKCYRSDTGQASIPNGRVINWAVEANGNTTVPIDSYVWMRPGETYDENEFGTRRDDYVFEYQFIAILLFGATRGAVISSTDFEVDNISAAQKGKAPVSSTSDRFLINNWTGDWTASGAGIIIMFAFVDLTPQSTSIGHGNFVQGPCPS